MKSELFTTINGVFLPFLCIAKRVIVYIMPLFGMM